MTFPKPAPIYALVRVPAGSNLGPLVEAAESAGGEARAVDQHQILIQLLATATPAMRALAAQVFNDPDNPKWREA